MPYRNPEYYPDPTAGAGIYAAENRAKDIDRQTLWRITQKRARQMRVADELAVQRRQKREKEKEKARRYLGEHIATAAIKFRAKTYETQARFDLFGINHDFTKLRNEINLLLDKIGRITGEVKESENR